MDGQALDKNPIELTAVEAAELIRAGTFTSEQFVQACLDRVGQVDDKIEAWAYLDGEFALKQAKEADLARTEGRAMGPLHGVPVAIKDIIDTHDMPTEDGTVLHKGEQPIRDATVVALLRQAGAVIMGKTVTTELAVYSPGKTKNPHDPARTPGGSSSGSAAVVASSMAPLAVGTQTNGSVIRPAAYCGVVGYKPTYGSISRTGILRQSRPLDQVGLMARNVPDAALIAEQVIAHDEFDPATRPRPRPRLLEVALSEPPVPPRLAFVKTPVWDQADETTHEAFAELVAHVNEAVTADTRRINEVTGEAVVEIELPPLFAEAHGWHKTVMEADLAKSFALEYDTGKDKLSKVLVEMLERGQKVLAVDYNRAIEGIDVLNALLGGIFTEFDAILTPAATGIAPVGLSSTGSPTFCTIWTFCGTPAITLPILQGENGMPLGVQLVGPKGDDARLLRTAHWLMEISGNG
jgi:Asp-tRNA(Asn)/Glu-tRNA(Gln) amidotransferase A subunit family amidase